MVWPYGASGELSDREEPMAAYKYIKKKSCTCMSASTEGGIKCKLE